MKIRQKGIYILPNLFTSGNLFCGFYAIISVLNGQYYAAALAIIIAAVFDSLDGKIARATNTMSGFGLEYDSLADIVSFGLSPSLLIYKWVLKPYGRIGWMAVFLYVICAALRLARFNAQSIKKSSKDFTGLPTPAAAAVISSWVILSKDLLYIKTEPVLMVITVYLLAFLMVSNIRYRSLKSLDLRQRKSFGMLLFFILTIYIVATLPQLMYFIISVGYAFSGPVESILFGKKENVLENLETELELK